MTNDKTVTMSRELAERLDSPHNSVRNAALESLRRILAAPVVERQESDLEMAARLVEGKTVSVDVSTCDTDAGNRLFCKIVEVMEDGDSFTLLAVDPEPNFETSPPAPVAVVLTVKEKRFLKIVCEHPGSKLNGGEANDDEGNALWERLETLGLIECVGSYKWKPTFDVIDLAISACLDKAKEMNR